MVWNLITGLAVCGVLTLLASPLLYRGWKHGTRYESIRETPTATPQTVADGQTVVLTGRVRTDGEPASAPVSGAGAVLAAWDVSRWTKDGVLSRRYWLPEARGVEAIGFVLQRDGHAVRLPPATRTTVVDDLGDFFTVPETETGVDADGLAVEVDSFETERSIAPTEEPPERLRALEERLGLDRRSRTRVLLPITRAAGTRRYRETAVEEGQRLTVRATVRSPRTADGDPRLAAPDDGPLLASTLAPSALARRYRWGYWKQFYGCLAVIVLTTAGVTAALVV